jgi:hypothetical protein
MVLFSLFFVSLLPEVHLHQSSKITRKSQYWRNQGFPCFLLVDGSIRIRNIGFIITVLAIFVECCFVDAQVWKMRIKVS